MALEIELTIWSNTTDKGKLAVMLGRKATDPKMLG